MYDGRHEWTKKETWRPKDEGQHQSTQIVWISPSRSGDGSSRETSGSRIFVDHPLLLFLAGEMMNREKEVARTGSGEHKTHDQESETTKTTTVVTLLLWTVHSFIKNPPLRLLTQRHTWSRDCTQRTSKPWDVLLRSREQCSWKKNEQVTKILRRI